MLKVFNQNWLNPNQQCAVLVKQMVDMLKNDEDLEIPRAECIYVDGKWETLVVGSSPEDVMERLEKSKGVISLYKSTSRDTDICLVVKRGSGIQFTNRKRGVSFNYRKNVTTEDVLSKKLGVPSEMADVVLRVLSFCALRGIDLPAAMYDKILYNETRVKGHGKRF